MLFYSYLKIYNPTIFNITMRTLELVQPFFTSFEFWDFFIFPPSYVVSKLSYSQRALGSKWGQ